MAVLIITALIVGKSAVGLPNGEKVEAKIG